MLSSSDIKSIHEAYASIYNESSIEEEFDILEELTDDEFQEIIEEVVYGMLDEGYDIDELEEIFDEELVEEIIDEAKVTMGRGGEAGGGKVTTGTGSRIAAQQRLDARKARKSAERKVARAETIKKAKKAVRDVVDKPAREYAAKRKIVPSKSGKQKLNISSLEGKQRTSAGRREVRKAVAKDVASRAVGKVKQAAGAVKTAAKTTKAAAGVAGSIAKDEARRAGRKAAHTAGKAAQAVKDAPGKAAGAAKRGLKGLIRRGAEKVARGAERVAKRMSEEVETFDIVVEFLCDYGIAEDLQEAQWLMVNEVDSEDIETILEAYGQPMTKRQEYLTKKVGKMNKDKSGSAHTYVPGKQNAGAALDKANQSAMQMRGI